MVATRDHQNAERTLAGAFFQLMADRDTRQVEDWKDVQTARSQAYIRKYGKLQQIGDSDVLTVTIMLATGPGQSFTARHAAASAALAAEYPEVCEAMQRSGIPMDVADPQLAD